MFEGHITGAGEAKLQGGTDLGTDPRAHILLNTVTCAGMLFWSTMEMFGLSVIKS